MLNNFCYRFLATVISQISEKLLFIKYKLIKLVFKNCYICIMLTFPNILFPDVRNNDALHAAVWKSPVLWGRAPTLRNLTFTFSNSLVYTVHPIQDSGHCAQDHPCPSST